MHVRVCRECGEEYRPDIALCADCGADLEDRYENDRGEPVNPDGTVPELAPLEPGVAARALFSGPPDGMRMLADTLVARGVPFQLVAEEKLGFTRYEQPRLVLVVPETEVERAQQALAEYRGRGTELGFTDLAATFGAAMQEGSAAPCPACGAAASCRADARPSAPTDGLAAAEALPWREEVR